MLDVCSFDGLVVYLLLLGGGGGGGSGLNGLLHIGCVLSDPGGFIGSGDRSLVIFLFLYRKYC